MTWEGGYCSSASPEDYRGRVGRGRVGGAPEDLAHSALLPKEAIFLQKPFELDAFTGVVDALLKP